MAPHTYVVFSPGIASPCLAGVTSHDCEWQEFFAFYCVFVFTSQPFFLLLLSVSLSLCLSLSLSLFFAPFTLCVWNSCLGVLCELRFCCVNPRWLKGAEVFAEVWRVLIRICRLARHTFCLTLRKQIRGSDGLDRDVLVK